MNINKLKVPLKCSFDLDNVLIDTNRAWCDLYNRLTGSHLRESDIREWDISKFVLPQHKELIFDLLNNKLLWESVQPVSYAVMYMEILSKDENVDISIITDTSPQTTEIKMNKLHKFYPFLNLRNRVFITGDKQSVRTNLLVDDAPFNLYGGDYYKLLYTEPWNMNFNASKNDMIRVNEWSEIYSTIQRKIESQRLVDELIY